MWVCAARLLLLLQLAELVPAEHLQFEGSDFSSIFFVGDLHGDIGCAKKWVRRTGLVDLDVSPWQWVGGESAMVFLGDYMDKGTHSRKVLELVRELTTLFPRNVVHPSAYHYLAKQRPA